MFRTAARTKSQAVSSKIVTRLSNGVPNACGNLIEELSDNLVKARGRTEPPFQTEAFEYARLIGADVIEADIFSDGVLSVFNGRIIIEVNRNHTAERKSYTVCHEIGHVELRRAAKVLIRSKGGDRYIRGLNERSTKTEEWMANEFAANLLMPKRVFQDKASRFQPSLGNAILLAQMFRTSLGATLRRIASLAIWECIVMWCTPEKMKGENQWAVKIQEFKSTVRKNGLICPRHKYVWWGGKIIHDASVSEEPVNGNTQIGNELWKIEAKREWHYVWPLGRQNRVMALLVPTAKRG